MYENPELGPDLYWRYKVPNTDFQLGVLVFGGVTDWEAIRMIIIDKSGNVTDCMDIIYHIDEMTTLQYSLTADYKLITYRLVSTSSETILFDDLVIGKVQSVNCYMVDTTYRISSEGKFQKEGKKSEIPGKELYGKTTVRKECVGTITEEICMKRPYRR